ARVSAIAAVLLATAIGLVLLRRRLARAPAPRAETWGCGFAAPTARMQYTASSFAEMLVGRFSWALAPRATLHAPRNPFPTEALFASHVPDTVLDRLLLPATRAAGRLSALLRPILLQPLIHLHVALLVATLVLILAWRFLA
ncbi:MAG TPA: oxidoreductase, partial [Anaeromyxobacteraceae bacterium]|nr:oxidoreductase [Anaeromyxobacteraceae bacterium]